MFARRVQAFPLHACAMRLSQRITAYLWRKRAMGLSIRLQDQIAALKQGLDIFSQLAALFLQATGNDLVACFGGDIVKMKGNLKPVLSDSIGPDDVGQADHRCFGRGCGDN